MIQPINAFKRLANGAVMPENPVRSPEVFN